MTAPRLATAGLIVFHVKHSIESGGSLPLGPCYSGIAAGSGAPVAVVDNGYLISKGVIIVKNDAPLLHLPGTVLQVAKWVALVFLPALTTLWLALGPIWGWPYIQEVGATLTALDAFLGAVLGVTAQALAKAQAAEAEATAKHAEGGEEA